MEGIRTCEGVGQGSFTFVRKLSGKSQGISETSGCGNHIHAYTVEALVSGHPQDAKKVFVPGAGRLQECENTEFVLGLSKTGFCEGGR